MKRTKNTVRPTLFQDYRNNPVYQWYHHELWHIYADLDYPPTTITSAKQHRWLALQMELRDVLEGKLKEFLRAELDFTYEQASQIVGEIRSCQYWENGGQGKIK